MANVTRQGREKIKQYLEEEVAPDIRESWRSNLTGDQQSLAQDIQIYTTRGLVRVGTRNPVLKYLEWGTRPHIITPDEAEALRWFNDEGQPVFAKRVRHPGTEPEAHLRSALDSVAARYNQR